MKKVAKTALALMMAAILVLCCTGCGDKGIVGVWECEDFTNFMNGMVGMGFNLFDMGYLGDMIDVDGTVYLEFNKDGTCRMWLDGYVSVMFYAEQMHEEVLSGTYNEDKKTITDPVKGSLNYKVSGNKIILYDNSDSHLQLVFKRSE